jgi:hypothetical protein
MKEVRQSPTLIAREVELRLADVPDFSKPETLEDAEPNIVIKIFVTPPRGHRGRSGELIGMVVSQ